MKSTTPTDARRESNARLRSGRESVPPLRTGSLPTSVIVRSAKDAQRQHVAIGKLMKMCQASPVVSQANRGITAEVRRDRDRGHE